MNSQPNLPVWNVCMLGKGNVGKSALTIQFLYDEVSYVNNVVISNNFCLLQFVTDYEPTRCDAYNKRVDVFGLEVMCSITDTAGK